MRQRCKIDRNRGPICLGWPGIALVLILKVRQPHKPLSPRQTRTDDYLRSQRRKHEERAKRERRRPKWKQIGRPQVLPWKKGVSPSWTRPFISVQELLGFLGGKAISPRFLPGEARAPPEEGAQTESVGVRRPAHRTLWAHIAHVLLAWNICLPHPAWSHDEFWRGYQNVFQSQFCRVDAVGSWVTPLLLGA